MSLLNQMVVFGEQGWQFCKKLTKRVAKDGPWATTARVEGAQRVDRALCPTIAWLASVH